MFEDPLLFLIPLFAAIIGWGTNVVAVKMMFAPIEFRGIGPIGWQGIIPGNAVSLAAKSTDLVTTKLIKLDEIFDGFDGSDFAKENLDAAVDELTDQVITETAEKHAKEMWAQADDTVKAQIRAMVRTDIAEVTGKILADIGSEIENILVLKDIVITAAKRDKSLIANMFAKTGAPEFAFIKRSGAYFGLLFGVVQMFAWAVYPAWWVLPFAGFFVGYITNFLAIKLIFHPAHPKRFGPFVLHGLFHKRQTEVSKGFAQMLSSDILNTEAMVEKMTTGASGVHLFGIVEQHIGAMIDKYRNSPMAAMVPPAQLDAAKGELLVRLRKELPAKGGFLYTFTDKAINVYSELFDRMADLDPESFEGVLRPAFQKDEWKLVIAGAVLGLGAGIAQLVFVFGGQLS